METIRILSYNVFLRPPPIHDRTSDYKWERVELLGKKVIPNYDIIAFEEAFGSLNKRRDALIQYGQENGLLYNHSSPIRSICALKVDGGLLLLSRYPIVEKDTLEYPRGCHSDWFACKGALYCRLKVGTKHLNIFSTHLQASYEEIPPPDSPAVKVRMQQLVLLHQFINKCMKSHRDEPCFLMGDFNVDGICPLNTNIFNSNPEMTATTTRKSDEVNLVTVNHNVEENENEKTTCFQHSQEYTAMMDILTGDIDSVPDEYKPTTMPTMDMDTQDFKTVDSEPNDFRLRYRINDLIFNHQIPRAHPVTTSNFRASTKPYERKSLDYIFEISDGYYMEDSITKSNSQEEILNEDLDDIGNKMGYRVLSANVHPFPVDNPNYSFMSDHYAVSTTIQM